MEAVLLKRLDEASRDGDINKLKELLEEDELLLDTVLTMVRNNPLHIAALLGHGEFTREVLLLKPGLATRINPQGLTPLHLAAARGHLQVAQLLVDKVGNQICLIRESKEGHTAAHAATINGKHDVIKMLIKRCNELLEKTTTKMESLLHLAVKAPSLDIVCYLIEEGINLNQRDQDGNTCLHLAVAKSNHQVIACLLDQEGKFDVNSRNAMGLTALDVLLVTSLDSSVDISLVNTLRMAGAVGSKELGDLESNADKSLAVGTPGIQRLSARTKNIEADQNLQSEAQTLLLVATLVATMTFQAISSPPGGFIGMPFEKEDATEGTPNTWFQNWNKKTYFAAGTPVLYWELDTFFVLVSAAFFSSVGVILCLLIAVPKRKVTMKFFVAVVWFSAFCTALAFGIAFSVIYNISWGWPVHAVHHNSPLNTNNSPLDATKSPGNTNNSPLDATRSPGNGNRSPGGPYIPLNAKGPGNAYGSSGDADRSPGDADRPGDAYRPGKAYRPGNAYRPACLEDNSSGSSDWLYNLMTVWLVFYILAGSWASARLIRFVWLECKFKIRLLNCTTKLRRPKANMLVKRIFYVVLMVCIIAVFCLSSRVVYVKMRAATAKLVLKHC